MNTTEQWRPRLRRSRGKTRPWLGARHWLEAVIAASIGLDSWAWSLALVNVEDQAAVVLMASDLLPAVLEALRAHPWDVLQSLAVDLERQVAWRQAEAAHRAIEQIRQAAR